MGPLAATSAQAILQAITSNNPRNKQLVDYILGSGLSQDDIVRYLSSPAMGQEEQSDIGRKLASRNNARKFLDFLKNSVSIASAGFGAYKLYQGAKGVFQAAQAGGNLAQTLMGQGQQPNLAQQILQTPGAAQAAGAAGGQAAQGSSFLSNLVKSVASVFGFKNKGLVNAVAKIVDQTGQEVADVYKQLAKDYDVSTPEKATKAATEFFKKMTEEQTKPTTLEKVVEEKERQKERMESIKPIEEVKKDLARDLKSAVIRQTDYNPEEKLLKVIFNNGHTYTYDDVPQKVYDDLTAGTVKAKTSGENQYGRWWVGKTPSAGASFNALIKKGGYNYQRIEDTPISEEEEEEYKALAQEAKGRAGKFLGELEKTEAAGKNIKGKAALTPEQIRNRRMVLSKHLESLRNAPKDERNKELLNSVEERLKTLNQIDKLVKSKKAKVLTEETLRFEKANGKQLLKKMLLLLPASVVKVLKNKIETTSEEEVLKTIKDYLLSKK